MLDYTVQIVSLRPHKKTILASGKTHTVFLGNLATLIWACGVFLCSMQEKSSNGGAGYLRQHCASKIL